MSVDQPVERARYPSKTFRAEVSHSGSSQHCCVRNLLRPSLWPLPWSVSPACWHFRFRRAADARVRHPAGHLVPSRGISWAGCHCRRRPRWPSLAFVAGAGCAGMRWRGLAGSYFRGCGACPAPCRLLDRCLCCWPPRSLRQHGPAGARAAAQSTSWKRCARTDLPAFTGSPFCRESTDLGIRALIVLRSISVMFQEGVRHEPG